MSNKHLSLELVLPRQARNICLLATSLLLSACIDSASSQDAEPLELAAQSTLENSSHIREGGSLSQLPDYTPLSFAKSHAGALTRLQADVDKAYAKQKQHWLNLVKTPGSAEKGLGLLSHRARYVTDFFDQYTMQGQAELGFEKGCEQWLHTRDVKLASIDQEMFVNMFYQETENAGSLSASFASEYHYIVQADNVEMRQSSAGFIKKQFNGVAYTQAEPMKKSALFASEAKMVTEAQRFKLDQLSQFKKQFKEQLAASRNAEAASLQSFSFVALPEDIDSTEVLNLVELEAYQDLFLMRMQHYVLSEGAGTWLEDGVSIELYSDNGIMLYQAFEMPNKTAMHYSLLALNFSDEDNSACEKS